MDMIHHPEYNSTLILRAEIDFDHNLLEPEPTADHQRPATLELRGFRASRIIRRNLLARRPHRDPSIRQDCTFFGSTKETDMPEGSTLCVLTPILEEGADLPYYHPRVKHIAFRYLQDTPPTIRIEVAPLELNDIAFPVDQDCRLYRICLALLDALHRYGVGKLNSYKKRVLHDQIIPREVYQDLYLIMRERHKDLVKTWQEVTDPLKHVYEVHGPSELVFRAQMIMLYRTLGSLPT